jgi:hypothetical protein
MAILVLCLVAGILWMVVRPRHRRRVVMSRSQPSRRQHPSRLPPIDPNARITWTALDDLQVARMLRDSST